MGPANITGKYESTLANNTDDWSDPPTLKSENGLVQIQYTLIT